MRYSDKVDNGKPAAFRKSDSRLYVVRIWNEDLGDGRSEWRAYVRLVPGGEARYVRTWDDLERFLKQHHRGSLKRPASGGLLSK